MVGIVTALLLAGAALLLTAPVRGAGHGMGKGKGAGFRPVPGIGAGSGAGSGPRNGLLNGPQPGPDEAPHGVSDPALMLDLIAAMLDAGQPLLPALAVLQDVVEAETGAALRRLRAALELGAPWPAAWQLAVADQDLRGTGAVRSAPVLQLRQALTFVATTGAPAAAVCLAQAAQIRRLQAREAERRAAALGVQLVVPLGLCALPAFIALTVAPLLLALLPDFQ